MQIWTVTVVGTFIASLSVAGNLMLLYLFLTRLFFRRTYFFYFSILAIADLFGSLAYAAVFSVAVYFEWAHDYTVMRLWLLPAHGISKRVSETTGDRRWRWKE